MATCFRVNAARNAAGAPTFRETLGVEHPLEYCEWIVRGALWDTGSFALDLNQTSNRLTTHLRVCVLFCLLQGWMTCTSWVTS